MRVVLLTNFIPPYRLPVYEALGDRCADLRVLVSVATEPNRSWTPSWGNLDVVVQRTVTFVRRWKHGRDFEEDVYVHVPVDTLPQLFRYRPDAVVSGELGARTLQAALYRIVMRKTRLVIWATVSEVTERSRGRIRPRVRRWLVRRADAVVTNGASGHRYIESLGFRRERIVCTGYAPVRAFFEPPPPRSPRTLEDFLFVGQLTQRKGIEPLLKALDAVARDNPTTRLVLRVVGEGPLLPLLKSHAGPPNLEILWLGHLSYEQLEDVYASSQVLAFPTLADEWGLVVNEAMLKGLPVLGSLYSQAVEELVQDGRNGWTFTPGEGASLRGAIERSLGTSPADLVEMGRRARETAESLTPERVAEVVARACALATA